MSEQRKGRRSKLTPVVQQTICNAIAVGVPFDTACALAGVSVFLATEWRARGEGTDKRPCTPLYASFAQAVAQARAQDEARRVARIHKAGEGGTVLERTTTTRHHRDGTTSTEVKERYTEPSWQADAWHLERSRPAAWGRQLRIDLEHSIRKAAELVAAEATAEGTPMTADEVLEEAQALLEEIDRKDEKE